MWPSTNIDEAGTSSHLDESSTRFAASLARPTNVEVVDVTRPSQPLVEELVRYFEDGPQSSEQHFLDLPRAQVVQAIPDHRPSHDFVELPESPLSDDDLMRTFLEEQGLPVPADASEGELQRLIETMADDAFATFRASAARDRLRAWLEENGVVYTA
jgi:hypothetical protein